MHLFMIVFLYSNDSKADLFRPPWSKSGTKFCIGIRERIQQKLFD